MTSPMGVKRSLISIKSWLKLMQQHRNKTISIEKLKSIHDILNMDSMISAVKLFKIQLPSSIENHTNDCHRDVRNLILKVRGTSRFCWFGFVTSDDASMFIVGTFFLSCQFLASIPPCSSVWIKICRITSGILGSSFICCPTSLALPPYMQSLFFLL